MLQCRHFLLFTGAMAVAFVAAVPSWVDQLLYHDTSPVHAKVIMFSISVLPFLSLTHIYGTLLTAVQEIRLFLRITLAATVFNIILNLLLIPHYGALGCAYAALLSQAGYALAVMMAARRRTGILLHMYPLFVVSVMAILFFGIAKMAIHFSWPLLPTASIAALALSLLFMKVVKISPAAIWQSISG
jgi:O-antigen/teichoic acid export membrane protein